MTIVDERVRVPQLDTEATERLARLLDREGVAAAMVIGSQARAKAGRLSDIDIGVWHDPDLDSTERLALQLGLAAAKDALGTEKVDITPQPGDTVDAPASGPRCQTPRRA